MNIKPEVIAALNGVLRHELTVINQYFLHARMLKNWGYEGLGKVMYKQSIRSMKNADALIERIFMLGGLPNLQDLGKLLIGETVAEAIDCDITIAESQFQAQISTIALLETEQDYVSRQLLEGFNEDLDEYIDWLGTQKDLMDELGMPNYLQQAVCHEG